VFEKDRIDPVSPSFRFGLLYRMAGFSRYPASYKHLAASLVRTGQKINTDIAEAGTAAEQELWQNARQWLDQTQERRAARDTPLTVIGSWRRRSSGGSRRRGPTTGRTLNAATLAPDSGRVTNAFRVGRSSFGMTVVDGL
jgi:hypothetical protein